MHTRTVAAAALAALVGLGLLAGGAIHATAGTNTAAIDPGDFTNPLPNSYFPLEPGTVSILRGSEDGARLLNRTTVTSWTKVIQGVTTTVVQDVLYSDGILEEKTTDWYAADNIGTVWYFGERTATYDEHGAVISTEGSWQAGVDGASAGIIMPANPRPTDAYRQESYRGHAEDQAWIVANHQVVHVPYGAITQAVRSYEWTRLEPGVVAVKFYGPGLGIVREKDISGGDELLELVRVEHP
jgi:hypothetical protein